MGSVLIAVFAGIFTLYTQEMVVEDAEGRWIKQTIFFAVGLTACLIIRKVNYQVLEGYGIPVYILAVVSLIATMIVGSEIKGAKSWIKFGPVGFQTSELAKLATIILLAKWLELKEREIERIPSLLIPGLITAVPMMLIVVQPDFGSAMAFAPILLIMLFVAGADILHLSSVCVFFGLVLSIPLYIEYYKITLVEPLVDHLTDLGQDSLLPAVNILKTDIWAFLEKGVIPSGVEGNDREYLTNVFKNENLIGGLREAAASVHAEAGGLLLRLLENETLIITIGGLFTIAAAIFFILRVTQGPTLSGLRRLYIPLGVLGISLLASMAIHLWVPFRYHQVVRITAFINPDKFPRDLAYQIRASKAAIGSGQLAGRGMFQGDMTIGRRPLVPEASTDFIFTSWSERTGFLGSVFILLVLVIIPLRTLQISFESRDRFGALLAAGISAMFFYHIAFNCGIALGLLPVTGLPLSFMSYGGSHLITCMLAVGIVLSIYRRRHAN